MLKCNLVWTVIFNILCCKIYVLIYHPFSWPESQYEPYLHVGKDTYCFLLIYSNIFKLMETVFEGKTWTHREKLYLLDLYRTPLLKHTKIQRKRQMDGYIAIDKAYPWIQFSYGNCVILRLCTNVFVQHQ